MTIPLEKILLEFSPSASSILPALKKISAVFGYVSKENAQVVADYFSLPLSSIYEMASFYDTINIKKQPALIIKVCFSTHCVLRESKEIIAELENILHIKAGDVNHPDVKLEKSSCMGRCGEGPIMVINEKVYERVTVAEVKEILKEYL